MNGEERRLALTKYARGGARDQPPVFVGRESVIGDIEYTAALAHEIWVSGAANASDPGLTRLVQGAPGAGKTALLRHLQEKWARGTPGPDNPISVNLNIDALGGAETLGRVVRQTLPASALEQWGGAIVRALASYLSGGDQAIGGEAERAAVAGSRRLFGKDRTDAFPAPIVVMVDEAQMVEPSTPPANLLRSLHLGRVGDIPVLPVFAGLGYLDSHLQRDGINISRFSNPRRCVHTLEGLSEAECRALFAGWLGHFGVDAPADVVDRWADALILDSQGWAMHTNGFLGALAEALAASDDPASLGGADMEAVRREAAKTRSVYYHQRYRGGIVQANVRWVGRAMAAMATQGALLEEDATAVIRDVAPPGGGDASALFDALIRRGFMQRVGVSDTFACPIPSLVGHAAVMAMQSPDLHIAATLGKVDDLKRTMSNGTDPVSRDALGRTPLHIAAECRWVDVAAALLDAGADSNAPDAGGITPRDAWPEFEWPHPYS